MSTSSQKTDLASLTSPRRTSKDRQEISPFVRKCLGYVKPSAGFALDIPAGRDRHAALLVDLGMRVIAADLDFTSLHAPSSEGTQISRVQLNANRRLPFRDQLFQLISVVHPLTLGLLAFLSATLASNGYLIVETFGAQGGNWTTLPRAQQVLEQLTAAFAVLTYVERLARRDVDAVIVKGLF